MAIALRGSRISEFHAENSTLAIIKKGKPFRPPAEALQQRALLCFLFNQLYWASELRNVGSHLLQNRFYSIRGSPRWLLLFKQLRVVLYIGILVEVKDKRSTLALFEQPVYG